MDDYMMFKQAIRGFDKDEVLDYIRKSEADANKQIADLEKDIRKRDKIITELKNRIVQKSDQIELLEQDIKDKYQKYIDNYEQIGALVYESRVKGNQIIADAQEKADAIIAEADADARRRLSAVQAEIDAKLTDGKKKYIAVQEEMNDIISTFNNMQRKFMLSYKEVHGIIQNMPSSLDEIDLDADPDDYQPTFKGGYFIDEDEDEEDENAPDSEEEDLSDLNEEELENLLKFKVGDLDLDEETDDEESEESKESKESEDQESADDEN